VAADLAFELRAFVAVIEIEIGVRGTAQRADCKVWNLGRVGSLLNRKKRFSVVSLVLIQQEFVVFGRFNRLFSGWFS